MACSSSNKTRLGFRNGTSALASPKGQRKQSRVQRLRAAALGADDVGSLATRRRRKRFVL
jgi:hypothetical protein